MRSTLPRPTTTRVGASAVSRPASSRLGNKENVATPLDDAPASKMAFGRPVPANTGVGKPLAPRSTTGVLSMAGPITPSRAPARPRTGMDDGTYPRP